MKIKVNSQLNENIKSLSKMYVSSCRLISLLKEYEIYSLEKTIREAICFQLHFLFDNYKNINIEFKSNNEILDWEELDYFISNNIRVGNSYEFVYENKKIINKLIKNLLKFELNLPNEQTLNTGFTLSGLVSYANNDGFHLIEKWYKKLNKFSKIKFETDKLDFKKVFQLMQTYDEKYCFSNEKILTQSNESRTSFTLHHLITALEVMAFELDKEIPNDFYKYLEIDIITSKKKERKLRYRERNSIWTVKK